jgi:hypothetical protein
MNEITPKIHASFEYDKFERILGNRNLNQKKIQRIMDDVKVGLNLLSYCPIIVYSEKEQLHIVDGQHRFEVSKQLSLPVYFVLANELNLKQIAMLNSRQDKWTQSDFLRCYINIGIEDYKVLDKFLKDYAIGLGSGTEFLMMGKITKGNVSQKFRDGNFTCNYLDETVELIQFSDSLFNRYVFYRDHRLITAVQELRKKALCDFEVLKEKIAKNPRMMDKQATPKEYMYNIERVYNHNNKIRQVII